MFSQTVEYALRAMVCLCASPARSFTTETIAEQTKVPPGYLSKIMRDLVVAGLVSSQRGPNGGFALTKAPKSISILEVVNAVDPIQRIDRCPLGNPAHLRLCPLHRRLDAAIAEIEGSFRKTMLSDIIEEQAPRGGRCATLTRQLQSPTHNGRETSGKSSA